MLSAGFGLAATIALPQAIYYAERGWESASWERHRGTITTSYTKIVRSRNRSRRETRMVYSYSADGRTYEDDRIRFALGNGYPPYAYLSTASRAMTLVADHPRGSSVDVYYDPRDPSYSVLRPGLDAAVLLQLAVSLALAIVAVLGLLFAARDQRLHRLLEG